MLKNLALVLSLLVGAMIGTACGSSEITLNGDAGAVTPDGAPSAEPDAEPPPPPDAAPPGMPDAALPDKHVVPIYIAASDESDADIATHVATYNSIMKGIRAWYTENLPGDPVTFYSEPVRVMRGHHTRAEWDDYGAHGFQYPDGHRTEEGGGCSMYYGAEWELRDMHLLEDAGLPPLGSGSFVYYAINGGGKNGSCGAGGYLGASELQLLTLAAVNCPEGRRVGNASDCSQTGAVAHELGHGFGLPHGSDRPACTDGPTLMDVWWQYDDGARLCVEDRTDLRSSGYFFPL